LTRNLFDYAGKTAGVVIKVQYLEAHDVCLGTPSRAGWEQVTSRDVMLPVVHNGGRNLGNKHAQGRVSRSTGK
jgi:hypothetical protein